MEMKTTLDGRKATIELAGKMTVNSISAFEAALAQLPAETCDLDIVIADVDYVSSAGLRALVRASKLAMKRGGSFRLLHPCEDVWGVLEMTGFSDVFTVER